MFTEFINFFYVPKKRFRNLVAEGSWIAIGQGVSIVGSFVLVRVLTEHLNTAEYGQLALGLTFATLVNQVFLGGLIAGIGRFYSIALEKGDLIGYLQAARRIIFIVTKVVLVIGLIVICMLAAANMRQWLWLASAALALSILTGLNSALNGIQNAARQRSIVALHGGMDSLLKIGFALVIMLWLGKNSGAVVTGFALSVLFVTLSQFYFLQRLIVRQKVKYLVTKNEDWIRQMWLFAWPLMVGGVFNWGYYASQRWALELFVSTNEVGKFYALTQVAYTPISLAGSLIMSFITPIIYARVGDPENLVRVEDARKLIFKLASVSFVVTLLAVIFAYFMHVYLFQILVAEQYREYSVFMPLIVFAAGLLQSSIGLSLFMTCKNQTKMILPLAVYGQALIICLNFASTYAFGIRGLMVAMPFGAALHFLWMLYITRRIW
jgi:O-antigen/teichoic acid export membrane protein